MKELDSFKDYHGNRVVLYQISHLGWSVHAFNPDGTVVELKIRPRNSHVEVRTGDYAGEHNAKTAFNALRQNELTDGFYWCRLPEVDTFGVCERSDDKWWVPGVDYSLDDDQVKVVARCDPPTADGLTWRELAEPLLLMDAASYAMGREGRNRQRIALVQAADPSYQSSATVAEGHP